MANGIMERAPEAEEERRVDPMLNDAEVTFFEMTHALAEEEWEFDELWKHWESLHAADEVIASLRPTPPPSPPPAEPLPQDEEDSDEPEEPEPELPQDSNALEESSDEAADDEVDVARTYVPDVDVSPQRYPPTETPGYPRKVVQVAPVAVAPSNHILVSVILGTGKRILDNVEVDMDSSMEELFCRVESKISNKQVHNLITRHGLKLERAELPIKWSGLQDGDLITANHQVHPPVQDRLSPSRSLAAVAATNDKLAKLAKFDAVSMGGFGDVIANANAADASLGLPSHWDLGLTAAIGSGALDPNLVPPMPPRPSTDPSDKVDRTPPVPAFSVSTPDEFDDLSLDAWTAPAHESAGIEVASQQDTASPSMPPEPRKVPASQPSPVAAGLALATPTSSRINDLCQNVFTPSRKLPAPIGQPKADTEERRKKLEEKQKQNDDIWANIAATLNEPTQPAKRSLMSHTASAGSLGLGRKMPPMARTRR